MASKTVSRRGFLGGAAAGAGLLGFGGCSAFSIGSGCGDKIKLAVVGVMGKGYGDWTTLLFSGMVEIVAFCDCDWSTRQKAQVMNVGQGIDFDMYSVPFYTDYRKLLDDCGKLGVEAMTVSTPDHTHAAIAIEAMRQGIHVYVQKPLVRTLWELDYFGKVAREKGVITQMGNQASGLKKLRRAVEILNSGLIGEVREVHVWTDRPIWPQGSSVQKYLESSSGADPKPQGLNWDAWLSVAAERPYKGDYPKEMKIHNPFNISRAVYRNFSWRGYYDFGCGAFGDMACHTMNIPFRGLELGAVERAECVLAEDTSDICYPMKSVVKMHYAARKSQVRGVELPPVTLTWYDGAAKPSDEQMPELIRSIGKAPRSGCMVVGEKGRLYSIDNFGEQNYIAMEGEKKMKSIFKHEAALGAPRVMPYCEERPEDPKHLRKMDGHYREFVDAIRGDGPTYRETKSRCFADIEYAIPQMEGILVGCVAQRLRADVKWDSAAQRFDSAAANALMKTEIREKFRF